MFLSASEFWTNIVNALELLMKNIGDWNWESIVEYVKNIVTTIGIGGIFALVLKRIIPLLKNSNKPLLTEIGKLAETVNGSIELIKQLKTENATLKKSLFAVVEYLEVSSEVNMSAKSLTQADKDKFKNMLNVLKSVKVPLVEQFVEKTEEIIKDDVITKEEAVELLEEIPAVEKVLGQKISDIKLE